jgi:tRNA 2-selenouridine synthase
MNQTIEAFLAGEGAVVDVRSPAEFARGHIPGAHSLPLLDDAERAEVGTLYARAGRQAAVLRGLALAGPRLEAMGAALVALADRRPGAPLRLHCWRGGLRSAAAAWLAGTLELPVVVLKGGYKSYRRWVLAQFERPWPLRLLGGRTGTGKTDLLLALRRAGVAVVDLEGLARHRGSSFGGLGMPPQPTTEHYENRIATALVAQQGAQQIWLEAESAQVGRCRIPQGLWRAMKLAPVLEVRRPLEERLRLLVAIYGGHDRGELTEATRRIARRLGPQRTAIALAALERGDLATAVLQMLDYYDRCYEHDLSSHARTAVDLGDRPPGEAAALLLERGLVQPAQAVAGST